MSLQPAYSGPVTGLTGADARYRDDRGDADPAVAAALAAYAAGTGGERSVLIALAASRLLVPVVAVQASTGPDTPGQASTAQVGTVPTETAESAPAAPLPGGARASGTGASEPVPFSGGLDAAEKRSEMAIPSLVGQDGRLALVAFTCADSLRRWQPGARPVPVPASGVFQAAVAESSAVVVDVAGPVPVTVEGARLAALAAGGEVPELHEDPDVWTLVAAAAGSVAPGIRVRLRPPPAGAAFTLELAPPPGTAGLVSTELAAEVADAVHARLAGRVRSGIAVLRLPG
jgi:hypothetical protein